MKIKKENLNMFFMIREKTLPLIIEKSVTQVIYVLVTGVICNAISKLKAAH